MKKAFYAVDVALLNSDCSKIIGKANISFSTFDSKKYPKYVVIEGHEFKRELDGIATPIVRYSHLVDCNCHQKKRDDGHAAAEKAQGVQ